MRAELVGGRDGARTRSSLPMTGRAIGVMACLIAGEAIAQPKADAPRDAPQVRSDPDRRARQAPEPPPELDTLKIAAAKRVTATSLEERTSGLWQSWIVSICEGCGPERKPYFRFRMFRSRLARAPALVPAPPRAPEAVEEHASPPAEERPSIYGDLSQARLAQIRRQPIP